MKNRVVLLFLGLFIYIGSVNALELCPMSDEYQKWLELSDAEKKKVTEPFYCASSYKDAYSSDIPNGLYKASISESRYNANETGIISSVKDQGKTNSCWAYATNSMIETSLLKKGISKDLSEAHMEYMVTYNPFTDGLNPNMYNRELNIGGNYYFSLSYLYSHLGGIDEFQLDTSSLISTNGFIKTSKNNIINKNVVVDVNDFKFVNYGSKLRCNDIQKESIKQDILEYGSVGSQIGSYSLYFTNEYYYQEYLSLDPNHAVTIVGWDDTIPKSMFYNASQDGAWIVKNSWGSDWGLDGYFYVSYDDAYICNSYYAIDADLNKYSNAYNSTELSPVTNVKSTSSMYSVVEFDKKSTSDEYLDKISVAVNEGNEYDVYIVSDINNINNKDEWINVGRISATFDGVTSLKFNEIKISDKYAVILGVKADEYMPVSCKAASNSSIYYYTRVDQNAYYGDVNNWKYYRDLGEYKNSDGTVIFTSCIPFVHAYTYYELGVNSTAYNIGHKEIYAELSINSDTLTVEEFKNNIIINNLYTIKNSSGEVVSDGLLGTGSTLVVNDIEYTVIVKGDLNGDGSVDLADLAKIYNYYLGKTKLNGYYYYAADVNKDTSVDLADLAKIYNFYRKKINKI